MEKPALIAFLPPIGGLPKTDDFFKYHCDLINTGDIVYSAAVATLCAGKHHMAWNFSASADVVNEHFSNVIWAIPCRIAAPPFDEDGFPYELATDFIENLKIPFVSITESIQSRIFNYEPDLHKKLSNKVVNYLKTIADKSRTIGTRGYFSADVLTKLGISNVEPVGCPSLYLNGSQLPQTLLDKKPFDEIRNIALCYSNYQRNTWSQIHKFMTTAAMHGYYFVEQTSNIVQKLLYYPERISRRDIFNAIEHYGSLDPLIELFRQERLRYFTNYANWKNFMSGMDFTFGARMHGLTPSVHAGVPAHFIAHDSRVREMCEYFQLPFSSEMNLANSGDSINTRALYEKTDYTDAMKLYPKRLHRFIDFLHANSITPRHGEEFRISDKIDLSASTGVEIELDPFHGTPQTINRITKDVLELMNNSLRIEATRSWLQEQHK